MSAGPTCAIARMNAVFHGGVRDEGESETRRYGNSPVNTGYPPRAGSDGSSMLILAHSPL